jgi:hypothetical protein
MEESGVKEIIVRSNSLVYLALVGRRQSVCSYRYDRIVLGDLVRNLAEERKQ